MDRHLNLFYSYDRAHLENNVTRALMILLKNLQPTHRRLFLREVVLAKHAPIPPTKLSLMEEDSFSFELQKSYSMKKEGEEEDRLTRQNGILVGIVHEERDKNKKAVNVKSKKRIISDALLEDRANEVSFLFESKLRNEDYEKQMQRYCQACFRTDEKISDYRDVFVETDWTQIAAFLERLLPLSESPKECFLIEEFLEYLNKLQLLQFKGFQPEDFTSEKDKKARRKSLLDFLDHLQGLAEEGVDEGSLAKGYHELGIAENNPDQIIFFEGLSLENLWFQYRGEGLSMGIVCGSGKKWRAHHLRVALGKDPDGFKRLVEGLQNKLKSIAPRSSILVMRIHSHFHYSQYRRDWLGNIGNQGKPYHIDQDYDSFLRTFGDAKFNSPKRLDAGKLQELCKEEIQRANRGTKSENPFPKWLDLEYSQYCYLHLDLDLPKEFFLRELGEVAEAMLPLLQIFKEGMIELNDFLESKKRGNKK